MGRGGGCCMDGGSVCSAGGSHTQPHRGTHLNPCQVPPCHSAAPTAPRSTKPPQESHGMRLSWRPQHNQGYLLTPLCFPSPPVIAHT